MIYTKKNQYSASKENIRRHIYIQCNNYFYQYLFSENFVNLNKRKPFKKILYYFFNVNKS